MFFEEEEYSLFTLDDYAITEANSLNSRNENNYKPTKKISDLMEDIKYNIFALKKVKMPWGDRIVLNLGEFTVS